MSYVRGSRYGDTGRAAPLIHWGSVFAGAIWALAITVLLFALWLALSYGSAVSGIRTNIHWFLAGSAMLALLIGGFIAGWFRGLRGWAPGLANGVTVWGLMLTVSLLIGIPSIIGGFGAFGGNILGNVAGGGKGVPAVAATTSLWSGFWTALIGLALAALGGALGGATPRAEGMYETVGDDRGRMGVVEEGSGVPRTGTDRY